MQAGRPIPLIRAAVVVPILRQLIACRLRVHDLLAEIGLSPRSVEQREALIPLRQAMRLLEVGSRRARRPGLGLAAGLGASFDSLGMLGGLVLWSETLEAALGAVFEHVASFDSGGPWWLVQDGDRARVCHRFSGQFDGSTRQADHFAVGLAINLIRTGAGPTWKPEEIELETSAGDDWFEAFAPLRGTRLRFDRPATAVGFPAAFLRRRLSRATEPLDRADVAAWLASAPANDFVESFQQVVLSPAREPGHPRIEDAAGMLGVSVRTLQRRLMAIGSSFDGLMQASRLETAEKLLRGTDARVLDIALDLGYSDHAHFSRAFRRWTGLSPRAYRYTHQRRAVERSAPA